MAPFILNILPRFGIGGKETTIINIIIGMRKRHLDGMLCCDGGDGLMDLARHDISWVHVPSFFPSSRINALQSFVWLRHIVHQYNPDLIVSHHRFSSLVGRAVARSLNVAYISMVHDLAAGNRVISHVALGGTVTVFSQAVKSHLITQFRLKEERIQVIPMGIGRVEKLGEEEVAKIRSQVICLPETRVVGFAGRLAEEKAPDVFLRAASLVLNHFPKTKFWVIGDGKMRNNLESLVQTLGIAESVRFWGWRPDVLSIMACVDFMVVPSLREGFGKVAFEALMLGKPLVATQVGALPELVQHEHSGLLVPPGQPDAVADAVMRLLGDAALAQRMSEKAREISLENNTVDAMCTALHAIYLAEIQRHRQKASPRT